jgi:hypothetical protein
LDLQGIETNVAGGAITLVNLQNMVIGVPYVFNSDMTRVYSVRINIATDVIFTVQRWCDGTFLSNTQIKDQFPFVLANHNWVWDDDIKKIRGTAWQRPATGSQTPHCWTYDIEVIDEVPIVQNIVEREFRRDWDLMTAIQFPAGVQREYPARFSEGEGISWTFDPGGFDTPLSVSYTQSQDHSFTGATIHMFPGNARLKPNNSYPKPWAYFVERNMLPNYNKEVLISNDDRYWTILENLTVSVSGPGAMNAGVGNFNTPGLVRNPGSFTLNAEYTNGYGMPIGFTQDREGNYYYLISNSGGGDYYSNLVYTGLRLFKYNSDWELQGSQFVEIAGNYINSWYSGLAWIPDESDSLDGHLYFGCTKGPNAPDAGTVILCKVKWGQTEAVSWWYGISFAKYIGRMGV